MPIDPHPSFSSSSAVALSVSVVGLERALMQYCSTPNEQPFDIKTVPIETAPVGEGLKCKPHPHFPQHTLTLTHCSGG